MRCFAGSAPVGSSPQGHDIAYTFVFDPTFRVPQILLEGERDDVQAYLSQMDRIINVGLSQVQKESHTDIYKAAEAAVRGELERQMVAEQVKARRLAEECDLLRVRLEEISRAQRADEEAIRGRTEQQWRERLGELKEEGNRMTNYMSEQLEGARAEIRALNERLMVRDGQLKKSQGRGQLGELEFAETALKAGGWTLERISGQARECDFKMDYSGIDVRFEIKNHLTNIPADDIKKFRRDMEEHRNVAGVGIFVALNVPVAQNKGRMISSEWKDDSGQLLLYISAFNDQEPEFVFMFLKNILDVYCKYRTLYNEKLVGCEESVVTQQLEALKNRVDGAIIHSRLMEKHLGELRLKLIRDKKTVMKCFDDSSELLKSCIAEYELTIALLLGNMAIVAPLVTVEPEAPMEEPADVVMVMAEDVSPVPKKRVRGPKKPPTAVSI